MNTITESNKEHTKAKKTDSETKEAKDKDNGINSKTANIIDESVEKIIIHRQNQY